MSEARATVSTAGFIDAIRLIALTGCRKSEISDLTWSEVDLENGFLRLRHSKVGPRAVPLGDEAVALLAHLKEGVGVDGCSRRDAGEARSLVFRRSGARFA